MLRDISLGSVYRTDENNLLEDFYIPALRASHRYDRAVGFFSANMISYAAQGLSALIANEGTMRMIFGGVLDDDDDDAIREGYDRRRILEKLDLRLTKTVEEIGDLLCYRRLEALAWMIANGSLTVKVALRKQGMYHEKIGILTDIQGDQVVFQGSANETVYALLPDFNFESINVFQCWKEELRDHYEPYIRGFERLWKNESEGTLVLEFPHAARERLVAIAKKASKPRVNVEVEISRELLQRREERNRTVEPKVPLVISGREFELREYQREALNAWRSQSCRGVLEMATGTGKTITCIYGAVKLYQAMKRLFFVVAVPYQSLADQWVDELGQFLINPIPCYGSREDWHDTLDKFIRLYEAGVKNFVSVVVVNKTLVSRDFQDKLKRIPGEHTLFVGDECHHHTSPRISAALPQYAKLRMGLSATPENYHDDGLSEDLLNYYGPIAYRFDLDSAIDAGFLSPYDYHVHLVDLTAQEADKYEALSTEIGRMIAILGEPVTSDPRLSQLLFARARLLGSARNKLTVLKEILRNETPRPFTLFYCGDGSVEGEDEIDAVRQIELVSKVLHECDWRTSRFTADESKEQRRDILDTFRLGSIDALVAIRCLDEGMDIPACRTAYLLASARNPRQFVQRRGRILRRHPGKEYAAIHDFVVRVPEELCANPATEKQLFTSELKRVVEFSKSSRNSSAGYRTIESLIEKFDLVHLFP